MGPVRLRDDLLAAVEGRPALAAMDELRYAYRRHLYRVAARDLTAEDPVALLEDVAGELADLADAAVEAALAIARTEVAGSDRVRLAVLALGKAGAQELNYISDIDLVFVA
ncbi:MAG: hypothetical protein LBR19_01885, partial [Bifidobacteriaceae bacterium]|nr:hypothetical protein [Bifidobacteriaceae bacterium]